MLLAFSAATATSKGFSDTRVARRSTASMRLGQSRNHHSRCFPGLADCAGPLKRRTR
jgi:hypothetical protein